MNGKKARALRRKAQEKGEPTRARVKETIKLTGKYRNGKPIESRHLTLIYTGEKRTYRDLKRGANG